MRALSAKRNVRRGRGPAIFRIFEAPTRETKLITNFSRGLSEIHGDPRNRFELNFYRTYRIVYLRLIIVEKSKIFKPAVPGLLRLCGALLELRFSRGALDKPYGVSFRQKYTKPAEFSIDSMEISISL